MAEIALATFDDAPASSIRKIEMRGGLKEIQRRMSVQSFLQMNSQKGALLVVFFKYARFQFFRYPLQW